MTTEYNRAAQESINLPSDDSGKVDQGKHRRKQTIERRRVIESGNETRVTQNDQIEMRRGEKRQKWTGGGRYSGKVEQTWMIFFR